MSKKVMMKVAKKAVGLVKKMVTKTDESKIGFKVVVKEGNSLVSATSAGLKVTYVTDKFVSARMWGGPMTVFDTLGRAVMFMEEKVAPELRKDARVYRCKYIPTKCNHVWRYRDGNMKIKSVMELPEKSVLAKKIMILKKVA